MNKTYVTSVADTVAAMSGLSAIQIPAAGTAGTGISETIIGVVPLGAPGPIPIGSVTLGPNAALTAAAANTATFNIYKRTQAAPSTAVLIATCTTSTASSGTGSWTQYESLPLTLETGAGSFVSPGDVITYSVVKNASGVATPAVVISISPALT
jgi:hypothetical protein